MWATRVAVNAERTVPYCLSRCEDTGRLRNFDAAAAGDRSLFEGLHFNDSDVFKTLEGVATVLAQTRDPDLERQADELIARIAAAQEPDGYLYTIRTSGAHVGSESAGPARWSNLRQGHELYNVGHLYEAAIAYADATGKDNLLAVATKSADFVADTFGPDALVGVPGHEEIELGLMRLARKTGRSRYAELARFFLDARGSAGRVGSAGPDGSGPTDNAAYSQDHLPVLEQTEAVGHAVRAVYLYIAMTEAALAADGESHADEYAAAVLRLWQDVVGRKLYLTGGIGARPEIEGFGEPYELPNDSAYAETCASIALVLWARRLFLLTGSADHYDVLERTLCNGLLAGVALGGAEFFYANPLEADGVTGFNIGSAERQPWFACSCCPTNVARFISTVGSYIFATSEECVYVNLYVSSEATVAVAGAKLQLSLATDYPWNGDVSLTVWTETPVRATVRLRLPGWARGRPVSSDLYRYRYRDASADRLEVAVNGDAVTPSVTDAGYLEITREWRSGDQVTLGLPMPVRFVEADDRVEADRGKVALERGPLVYCLEQADNGGDVRQQTLTAPAEWQPEPRPDLLGGITVLTNGELTAVPYFAWGHRGAGSMAVWLPEAASR